MRFITAITAPIVLVSAAKTTRYDDDDNDREVHNRKKKGSNFLRGLTLKNFVRISPVLAGVAVSAEEAKLTGESKWKDFMDSTGFFLLMGANMLNQLHNKDLLEVVAAFPWTYAKYIGGKAAFATGHGVAKVAQEGGTFAVLKEKAGEIDVEKWLTDRKAGIVYKMGKGFYDGLDGIAELVAKKTKNSDTDTPAAWAGNQQAGISPASGQAVPVAVSTTN